MSFCRNEVDTGGRGVRGETVIPAAENLHRSGCLFTKNTILNACIRQRITFHD